VAITLDLIEGPAAEPITLAEAKRFCRIDADLTEDDPYLEALITATREFVERRTGRAFGIQTFREWRTIPRSGVIRLCRAPLAEVLSVEVDGESLDQSPSLLLPGNRIRLEGSWVGRDVLIEYRAGWETPPKIALQALQILIAHWYEQREPVVLGTIIAEVPNHYNAIESALSWGSEMPSR